jgi:hypothetical protein
MEYRAISLHQPWASLVALGIKKYETRSWTTEYRGKLLICSTKKVYKPNIDLINRIFDLTKIGTFNRTRLDFLGKNTKYTEFLPLGRVLCVVDLVDCSKIGSQSDVSELEQLCDDWQAGRYAWKLSNHITLPRPIPIKGKHGLWTPDNSIIQEVEGQI